MNKNSSIVAIYPSHTAAEAAIEDLQKSGLGCGSHGVYYRSRTELRRIRLAARAGCHLIGREVPGLGPRVMCERYNFNRNLLIFIDLLKFYNCRYWSDRQG
jgi:hypothetical protein